MVQAYLTLLTLSFLIAVNTKEMILDATFVVRVPRTSHPHALRLEYVLSADMIGFS